MRGVLAMSGKSMLAIAITTVSLAVLGSVAISAQDKYTVKVPQGLAFSEFRGYENWQVVAISQTEELMSVILANPAMIDAYRAGVPGNGKPFPDGSRIAKIHWKPKKSAEAPTPTTVPSTLDDVDFIVRDSKRFPIPADGDMLSSTMMPRPTRSHPLGAAPTAGTRAIRS
jgi:hypothetical protein